VRSTWYQKPISNMITSNFLIGSLFSYWKTSFKKGRIRGCRIRKNQCWWNGRRWVFTRRNRNRV